MKERFNKIVKLKNLTFLFKFYKIFLKEQSLSTTFALQSLGIACSFANVFGISSLFPFLGIFVSGKSEFIEKFIIPRFGIPSAFISNYLAELMGLGIVLAFVFKSFLFILYSKFMSDAVTEFSAKKRSSLNREFILSIGKKLELEKKSTVIHLNNQLIQLVSFNYGLIDLNLKFYVLATIFLLLIGISLKLTLISFVLILIVSLFGAPMYSWTRKTADSYFQSLYKLQKQLSEFLDGAETIKSLNLVDPQVNKFERLSRELIVQNRYLSISRATIFSFPELVMSLVFVFGLLSLRPEKTEIVLIGSFAYSLIKLMGALGDFNSRLNSQLELLKVPIEIYGYFDKHAGSSTELKNENILQISGAIHEIVFENISVIDGDKKLLKNISVNLPIGKTIQLLGKNGSGKSTFAKCLLQLVPYSGKIKINGIDLNHIDPSSLYSRINYLSQDQFLFNATILENILIGSETASAEDAIELCKKLGFEEFIRNKKDGYNTLVSEGSENLSGGEKQSICIARTLLRNGEVIIFDEFSNHLDSLALNKVTTYLNSMKNKTIIIISHANSKLGVETLYFCDGMLIEHPI